MPQSIDAPPMTNHLLGDTEEPGGGAGVTSKGWETALSDLEYLVDHVGQVEARTGKAFSPADDIANVVPVQGREIGDVSGWAHAGSIAE
jgi:hypothetical protein